LVAAVLEVLPVMVLLATIQFSQPSHQTAAGLEVAHFLVAVTVVLVAALVIMAGQQEPEIRHQPAHHKVIMVGLVILLKLVAVVVQVLLVVLLEQIPETEEMEQHQLFLAHP
jgi:NADH:ubiquinone oxidoreductase subunit 6 (subunit J)